MREEVIERVSREKIIAIVRGVGSEQCMKVAQALYDGGIRLMEVTYDQSRPESWDATAKAIGDIVRAFAGDSTMISLFCCAIPFPPVYIAISHSRAVFYRMAR